MPAYPVTTEQISWEPTIDRTEYKIPIEVIIAEGALEPGAAQTHVYLGMGEGKHASLAALKTLSAMGIASTAVILPFHHLARTPDNFKRTLIDVPQLIAKELNGRADTTTPTSIIGHSQSGYAALLTASEAPELFDNVAAWSTVGLTSEAFGTTPDEKRKEFYRRMFRENLRERDQHPLHHPGNIVAGMEIGRFLLADFIKGRLKPKVDYALNLTGLDQVQKLVAANRNVAIFGAENDPLFPKAEYLAALGSVGLERLFHTIPGSHSNPLAAAGREQLTAIGNWLTQSRAPQTEQA
jgi:pimeloyl-ACP methyl ester carboxylesterase